MAKKSEEKYTLYPLSDPKHCRKPQQEDSPPAVKVSNLALLLRVGRFPKVFVLYSSMRFIQCFLFMGGKLELRIQAVDLLACYRYRSCILHIQDTIILYCAING